MKNLREIPWPRVLVEGAVIVVSILLAFWIDAWWDGRQDREEERAVLSTLLAEFQEIREHIDDIEDYQVAIKASAVRLAELAEAPDPDVSDHEINRLLEDQVWGATPENFSAPKLNAVIARGDIVLISNRELRSRLSLLPDEFAWISSSLQEDMDFLKNRLEPFLFKNSSLLHIYTADALRPGTSGFSMPKLPFEPKATMSHRDLLQSREFQNLMLNRSELLDDIISLARTPDLPDQIDDAIRLIEQELSK